VGEIIMRRLYWFAPLAGTAAVGAALWFGRPMTAAPKAALDQPAAVAAAGAPLLLSQIVLFNSGVGYFQRDGQVVGDARVDLSFPQADVNDLLKSLVVRDLGKGQVTTISYDSPDPVERTLQSFAIDLTRNPSLAQVLVQTRGEKVEIAVLASNPGGQPPMLTGTIVGVEKRKQPGGKDEAVLEADVLNLWCADGLRSVRLSDVQRLRFLNATLDDEVKQALGILARAHDTRKKGVSVSFAGQGQRDVRLGYVIEAPVWKTSYRLVLDAKEQPLLQGWAIVENPTDEDWTQVKLALVAGRPLSFKMDLYNPLFAQRPTVEPEWFAGLRPPTYHAALEGGKFGGAGFAAPAGAVGRADKRELEKLAELRKSEDRAAATALGKQLAQRMNLGDGVAAAAVSAQLGDAYQYLVGKPINIPRQKSALVPIVQGEIQAVRLSIYNPAVHTKHPLLGLKLNNNTGSFLMQGPITVFEGSTYAGDARLPDVSANTERLISYAVDLNTEVETKHPQPVERLTAVKIDRGVLYRTTKMRTTTEYFAKNRGAAERTLWVEHPYHPEFKLADHLKPAERTREMYRFELKLAAGKHEQLTVVEERDATATVALTNTDDPTISVLLSGSVASESVKKALREVARLKALLAETQREAAQQRRELQAIEADQARLRQNLERVPPTSDAYKRYLKKFDDQETVIEEHQSAIKKLNDIEFARKTALDQFLANLKVD
jgi:hypothetical protein